MGLFGFFSLTGKRKKKLNLKVGYKKFSTRNRPGFSIILPIASIDIGGKEKDEGKPNIPTKEKAGMDT